MYGTSEWDSNYDGRAIFDFDTDWYEEERNTRFVSITTGNLMNPNIGYYGDYTLTLTDVTGLTRLVSNTNQRRRVLNSHFVGIDAGESETEEIQHATSFKTGSNLNGYTLDSITAYIEVTGDFSTVPGAPAVAIHSSNDNSTADDASDDVPGTKLCDLQGLLDYDTGLNLSNGDWPDELYAPDCADNTLAASTTYWVVFSEDSSTAQTYFTGEANSEAQDPHSASGWGKGDTYYRKTGANAWVSAGLVQLAIGVYGTPK